MRHSGMYRIVLAAGIAFGLASLFQNCSQVNFGVSDTKNLVQGGVTSSNVPTTTTTAPTSSPDADQGICVLTCTNTPTDSSANEEHEFANIDTGVMCSTNPKPKSPVNCSAEDEGNGSSLKPVVQSVSGSDSHPRTACMPKSACDQIGANLASGKLVLMKVESNMVSTLRGARFEQVSDPSECEDSLTDNDVKVQVEPEG